MKKTILIITIVITAFLLASAGLVTVAYVKAKTDEPKTVSLQNLENLNTLNNIKKLEMTTSLREKVDLSLKYSGSTAYTQSMNIDEVFSVSADTTTGEVSLKSAKSNQAMTLSLKDYLSQDKKFAGDKSTIKSLIDKGSVKITDVEVDGVKMWRYQIKDSLLNKELTDAISKGFEQSFNSEIAKSKQKVEVKDIQIDFAGLFDISFYISKKDRLLKEYTMETSDPVNISFSMVYANYGNQQVNAVAKISAIYEKNVIDKITLQDNYAIKVNPVLKVIDRIISI